MAKPQVLIVGGGMITHDQILPTLYHMQQRLPRLVPLCPARARQPVTEHRGPEDLRRPRHAADRLRGGE